MVLGRAELVLILWEQNSFLGECYLGPVLDRHPLPVFPSCYFLPFDGANVADFEPEIGPVTTHAGFDALISC